jgi:hypothetical protein
MRKWYSVGLVLLVLVLAASLLVACESREETTTTAVVETTTTAAVEATTTSATEPPETTTSGGVGTEVGIYFENLGNYVVRITEVPAPGLAFPVHTFPDDEFACTIEAFDAVGNSLGNLETDNGEVNYGSFLPNIGPGSKIVVTASTGVAYEYIVD